MVEEKGGEGVGLLDGEGKGECDSVDEDDGEGEEEGNSSTLRSASSVEASSQFAGAVFSEASTGVGETRSLFNRALLLGGSDSSACPPSSPPTGCC